VNFVCHCKCLAVLACITLMVMLSGCGGVNAGGGASPAAFFLPGVAGYDGPLEKSSPLNASYASSKETMDPIVATAVQPEAYIFAHRN